jgi:hypothetical protein
MSSPPFQYVKAGLAARQNIWLQLIGKIGISGLLLIPPAFVSPYSTPQALTNVLITSY